MEDEQKMDAIFDLIEELSEDINEIKKHLGLPVVARTRLEKNMIQEAKIISDIQKMASHKFTIEAIKAELERRHLEVSVDYIKEIVKAYKA